MPRDDPIAICLFCGSRDGRIPAYREAAEALGKSVAARGWSLVYGGSSIGLMAAAADSALRAGGHVQGVIPAALVDREVAHQGLSELSVVQTMSQRKEKMAALSDAFVILPGGIGTMDELFEVWTWRYLGAHDKPSVLINVNGFYDPLASQVALMHDHGFLTAGISDTLVVATDVDDAMSHLAAALQGRSRR